MRVIVLILTLATTVFPQAQNSSGDLHGTVSEPVGAVLSKVPVTITQNETGWSRETLTDEHGVYRFFLLNPDSYQLRFAAPGFALETRRFIQVGIGQSLRVDAQLTPAAVAQEVVVVGQAPFIEVEKTQQADTVTNMRIDKLPINRRSYLDFSLLTPGVADSQALISFSLPQTPDSGLSFSGQNGRSNSVTIDGVDNNDNAVGAVRSTLSQEAIQEFQINRSNYSAEFGRAAGGLINIVSRSGGNAFSGTVFAFVRDQIFDARTPFAFGAGGSSIDPPFSRLQSGFTVSGPIESNRTFFFLSYEGLRQRESNFATFLGSDAIFGLKPSQEVLIRGLEDAADPELQDLGEALDAALTTSEATYPGTIQLLQDNSGVFPYRNNDNQASLRIDHQASERHLMFMRTSFSDVDAQGGRFGGIKGPSRGTNLQAQDFAFVFGDSYFRGPNRVNDFRFQFSHRKYNTLPVDPFGPEININGTALVGRDFFLPSLRTERRWQWVDNFTFVSGKHELKFGGDFHHLSFDTQTEVFFGGRFIFGEAIPTAAVVDRVGGAGSATGLATRLTELGRPDLAASLSESITSLQAFNLGWPLAYQQGFGDPRARFRNNLIGSYVQDKFRVSPRLTVNLGLRYDLEVQPSPVHRDTNNFAPRLGFAFSPDGRTVVRGGYGIYFASAYQAVVFVERVLDGSQISQILIPLNGVPALGIATTSADVWTSLVADGVIGQRPITEADIASLGLEPGSTPPVLFRSAPELVNPYSQQLSFNVERELSGDLAASVSYLMNKGTKILRSRNTNLRIAGSNEFGPTFGPVDSSVFQNNQVESSGSSIYHGMTATLRKRFSDFHEFQVSYTFSKALDDTTDFIMDLQAANQLDLQAERALSAFDQRHRFVLSGVFTSPFERGFGFGRLLADLSLSPIVTLASGRPFNLLMGFDANEDGNPNTDRPAAAGRNTGRGPGFASVDLRVTKTFFAGRDRDYRVEAIGEIFNLFNRVNYSGLNNIVGTSLSSYDVTGDVTRSPSEPLGFTSAFAPRQIQLGVKFRF